MLGEGGGGGGGGYFGGGGGGGAGGGSGGGGGAGSSYAEPHATGVSSSPRYGIGAFVEVSYTPQLTCDQNPTLRIGQQIFPYVVICATTLTDKTGDIQVEGNAPNGMVYEIGPEVRGGPLVLVLDDWSGRVQGPAHEYHIVVRAVRFGGLTAQADVNIAIRP